MTTRLSILKNTLALAVPQVLNPFISFLLILVISRYLGVEGLGQYSLVLAYVGIFGTFAALGLADLVVREVARYPNETHVYFFNAGIFGTISSVIFLIFMDLTVALLGYERPVVLSTFIMSATLLASTIGSYVEAIFRSVGKSKYIALSYVVENAIRVVVSVILLLNGYGIVMLFLAVAVTRFMGMFLLTGFYIKILGRPSLQLRSDILWVLAKQSPTFTSIAVFSTIHLSMDSIMLSKLQTIESVGIYSAADRLLTICKTLPTAFASALLPFFTKELLQGKARLQGLTQTSLRYTFILLFPIVAGTAILADQIIPLIYGAKFVSAGPVLQLHIVSLIPFSMVYILAQVLIATDNQKIDLSLNIIAAIINFILNFIFIPMYAEIGAVLATLSSILIFNQIQYWYVERYLFKLGFISGAYKAIAAAAGMAAVTYLLRDLNLFLNIFVSALVYLILLIVLGAVSKSELQLLKQIFLKKSGEQVP